MKIKHLYLALSTEDSLGDVVSDFNFQSDFITDYIEKQLRKLKCDADDFNMIMIRGRNQPQELFFIQEQFKCLTIEVSFDIDKYKNIYPFSNKYPIEELIKPVLEKERFSEFLFEMIMNGLDKLKKQKAPIPSESLITTLLEFKSKKFINKWTYKKRVFKEIGITAYLNCELTCNYFTLELLIEKSKTEVYRKTILKTLASAAMYKDEFKDIKIIDGHLLVEKDALENNILFDLELSILM
jgi:hypothetical protein